ncbi:hypothetical protein SLS58_006811 [Diplodia intermedia]|uniref:RRM domain-containing protein n=1 Tax=Diplodia intermedia TaxID=856260 RepID=A0ABR3TLX9_9PEZI
MSKSEKSSKKASSGKSKKEKPEGVVPASDDAVADTTVDVVDDAVVKKRWKEERKEKKAKKKKEKEEKKDKSEKDKKEKKEKKENKYKKSKQERLEKKARREQAKVDAAEDQPPNENSDDAPTIAPKPIETVDEPKPEKSKKRKHEETSDEPVNGDVQQATTEHSTKEKKQKKAKTSSAPAESDSQSVPEGDDKSATRFIVFIGNLPYTATKDSVAKHFAKLPPTSIRAPMTNDNKKSKGFAFLEFDRYDYMKSCLKLYHHSSFDDGKSAARKINVELTAGGGGAKSEARKEKLKHKNERLNEQRKRRAEAEAKEKTRADKKAKHGPGKGANAQPVGDQGPPQYDGAADEASADNGGIHPARLAMMRR